MRRIEQQYADKQQYLHTQTIPKANCTLQKSLKEQEKEKNRSRYLPVNRMKQNLFEFSR
jgi:hypothetical protein